MKRILMALLFATTITIGVRASYGQQATDDAGRIRTKEQLGQLLDKVGPMVNVSFRQSQKQPFNFVGILNTGLANADSLEIVIAVTPKQTIGFRIYPHYKGGYINVDKVKNDAELMRYLLRLSDQAFLFWGVDDTGDVFAGYTVTLESGFPDAALTIVIRSIKNLDGFISGMKPAIEGSTTHGG